MIYPQERKLTKMSSQPKDACIRVRPLGRLDAHVCRLSEILGPPSVHRRGPYYVTGWAFCYPKGGPHWVVSHVSEAPVSCSGLCTRDHEVCWELYGEVADRELMQQVGSYLFDGDDFYDASASDEDG